MNELKAASVNMGDGMKWGDAGDNFITAVSGNFS